MIRRNTDFLKRNNYASLGMPVGPYVHFIRHGDTLYLSGLTAYGTKGQGKGMSDQIGATFQQIERICQSEGTALSNIIKVTLYVTDMGQLAELRQSLFEVYGDHIPASSLVRVESLFSSEVDIEIEAIIAL